MILFNYNIFYYNILMPHKSKDERPRDRKRDRKAKLDNIYSGKHIRQVLEYRQQQQLDKDKDKHKDNVIMCNDNK